MRRVVTATISPGGYGKTALSLSEAIAMAVAGLRVWYISGEDDKDEIDRRIAAYCQHHKISQLALADRLFVDDRDSYPIKIAKEGRNQTVEFDEPQLKAFEDRIRNDKIDVAIFDPFVRFHSCAETNQVFDAIVDRLGKICIAQNCNVEIDHHTRKIAPGQEITVDDARGGGALVNSARSCRVLNRMTSDEADQARISKSDRERYLKICNGKRNMAPAEDAKWFRLASVYIPNGDNVQAVEPWDFPKVFAEVTIGDQDHFRNLVRTGNYRVDSRSPNWLGHELAKHYDRDVTVKGDCAWLWCDVKDSAGAWIYPSPQDPRSAPFLRTCARMTG